MNRPAPEIVSEPQEFLELYGKRTSVIKPGLDRIRAAWESLGYPGKNTPTVLVAGTNGKGSTSGLLWHMLAANGVRTGFFSSPHLIEFRERVSISDHPVTNEELLKNLIKMKAQLKPDAWDVLSFFEINTLLALFTFQEFATEVNVLEVGLGGRLDCTNIVGPLVSVITSIGLDHAEFLGNTTDQVAREKSGIMRPHRVCLWGGESSSDQTADLAIKETAAKMGTVLKVAGIDFGLTSRHDATFTTDHKPVYTLPRLVKLWPGFLQKNFVMAAKALEELRDAPDLPLLLKLKNITLTTALERFGSSELPWPVTLSGRFQHVIVEREGVSIRLLIDVCHNPHGAAALAAGLEETGLIPYGQSRPALLSILLDKDDSGIWQALKGKISEAFLFKIPSERSWSREQTRIPGTMSESFADSIELALSRKELQQNHHQPWLICGSVAAVGEVFKYFKNQRWTMKPADGPGTGL